MRRTVSGARPRCGGRQPLLSARKFRYARRSRPAYDAAEVSATARDRARRGLPCETSRVEMRVIAPSGEEARALAAGAREAHRRRQPQAAVALRSRRPSSRAPGFLAWQVATRDRRDVESTSPASVACVVSPDLRRGAGFQGGTFTCEDLTTVFYLDYDGSHTLRGERSRAASTAAAWSRPSCPRTLRVPAPQDLDPRRRSPAAAHRPRGRRHLRQAPTSACAPRRSRAFRPSSRPEMTPSDADGYRTIVRYDGIDYDRGLTGRPVHPSGRWSARASSGALLPGLAKCARLRLIASRTAQRAVDGGAMPEKPPARPWTPTEEKLGSVVVKAMSVALTRGSFAPPVAGGARDSCTARRCLLAHDLGRKSGPAAGKPRSSTCRTASVWC